MNVKDERRKTCPVCDGRGTGQHFNGEIIQSKG